MAEPGEALINSRKKKRIFIKPSKRGDLHRALGVPEGQNIPAGKLQSALNSSSPDLRRKANFARNAKSFSH